MVGAQNDITKATTQISPAKPNVSTQNCWGIVVEVLTYKMHLKRGMLFGLQVASNLKSPRNFVAMSRILCSRRAYPWGVVVSKWRIDTPIVISVGYIEMGKDMCLGRGLRLGYSCLHPPTTPRVNHGSIDRVNEALAYSENFSVKSQRIGASQISRRSISI